MPRKRLILTLVFGVAAVIALIARAQRLPDGPQAIIWDQQACAHCRMLIGEPGYAAQLQTDDGQVLDFDDPGCLLRFVAEQHPHVRQMWFRHAREDRWLRGDAVAFRRVAASPMGWGLAAVGADEPHDLDREQALQLIAARAEK
jgi:hypothetical protein